MWFARLNQKQNKIEEEESQEIVQNQVTNDGIRDIFWTVISNKFLRLVADLRADKRWQPAPARLLLAQNMGADHLLKVTRQQFSDMRSTGEVTMSFAKRLVT